MEVKISIITVTYNSEKYLSTTLDAVLKQEHFLYEYYIVDGSSTDETLNIVKSYIPGFKGKLKVLSEKDNGIYDAMNKGLKLVSGNVIGIVNSDDFYNEYTLSNVKKAFEEDASLGCLYSDAVRINSQGDEVGIMKASVSGLKYGMALLHPTCFIKASVYEKIGGYDTQYRIAADYDLGMRMQHNGVVFKKSSYPLTKFRTGGASAKQQKVGIKNTFDIQRHYIGIGWAIYVYFKAYIRLFIFGKTFD